MTNLQKEQQLKNFKILATGLFLLMAAIFITLTVLQKEYTGAYWMGYAKAFAEAAMVGALADWFAVTALFHHPMGLPIPHTNLIENSKQRIGDNLGSFVVDNFLTAENLKPYIAKLEITKYVSDWLQKDKNKTLLIEESSKFLKKTILKLDDDYISDLIAAKGADFVKDIKINDLLGNGINYLVDKGMHEKIITFLVEKIKKYLQENEELVKEKVKAESSFLIPGFVDNMIAKKITGALGKYFDEIQQDKNHKIRKDIIIQLKKFAIEIRENKQWETELNELKSDLISSQNTHRYATDIWKSIKSALIEGLEMPHSALRNYFEKSIHELSHTFTHDMAFVEKIDKWVRYNAYKAILKNASKAGELISNTVGNWQGKDLSEKLELEVGKDLQFIRINGTIVGGLVGLIIYTLVHNLL